MDINSQLRKTVWRTPQSLLNAAQAGIDPEGFFRRQSTRTAPFTVRFPGLGEVLFVSTMDGARDILMAPTELCQAPLPSLIEPIVGRESLILLSGDHHRRIRGLVAPALRGERTYSYVDAIAAAATEAIDGWRPGDVVAVREVAEAITLDVIIRVVFGVTDRDRRGRYSRAITELMRANTAPLMLVPALRREFGGHGPWARLVARRDRLDRLLAEDIVRRRRSAAEGEGEGEDILGLLIDATDEHGRRLSLPETCQQLRTLLAAGHETTATALTWAMYHIHHDDEVHRRLLHELSTVSAPADMVDLPYLRSVIYETLRLHPTVSIVLRRLTGPLSVAGVACSAGDIVGIALPALHTNPQLWPDPERFDPDRFADGRPSPFAFAPFGGGYRRCPGATFAKHELAVTIGTVLTTVQLRLPWREHDRRPPRAVPNGITAVPNRPITLEVLDRIDRRRPPAPADHAEDPHAMSPARAGGRVPPH